MIRTRLLIAAVAALAAARPAAAWDNQGHMATGAIAYDVLAADPHAVAAITQLMRFHPDRARFDTTLGALAGAARDRRLFELMARWPDDIRGTAYDRPGWHYAVKVVSGATILSPLTFGDAIEQFARQLDIARDGNAPLAARAVALCWVFHITGDMHQPLHAGHRLSWDFPRSDRAGTIGWVRTVPGAKPLTLHDFWDGAADQLGGDTVGAEALAKLAEAATPVEMPAAVPTTAFAAWVAASRDLAATVAYRGAALAESHDPATAPVLTTAYQAEARRIAIRRVGEAGRHLAGLFMGMAPARGRAPAAP